MSDPAHPAVVRAASVEPGAGTPHGGMSLRTFTLTIAATMAVGTMAMDFMMAALPAIRHDLGIGHANDQQLILSVFMLSMAPVQLVCGPLSDRYGRRLLLLASVAGYVAASFAAALAPGFAFLVFARVLQGICVGATRTVALATVRDCYNGARMARIMSSAFAMLVAVPIVAPAAGQVLLLVSSWHALFVAMGVAGLLLFAWLAFMLPETLPLERRRSLAPAVLRQSLGLVIGEKSLLMCTGAQAMLMGSLLAYLNLSPQLFTQTFGAGHWASVLFSAGAMALAAASVLNSRIVERFGPAWIAGWSVRGFCAVNALHCLVLAFQAETLLLFLVLQGLSLFCFAMCNGNLGAVAMRNMGAVSGMAVAVQGTIVSTVAAIAGTLIARLYAGTPAPLVWANFVLGVIAVVFVTQALQGAVQAAEVPR